MRLATEETWAQLAGALAPASLTRSISQVRAKLADHYRDVLAELAQRSEQLEAVRRDLTQHVEVDRSTEVGADGLGRAAARGYRIAGRAARSCASKNWIANSSNTSRWNRNGTSSGPTIKRKSAGCWPRFAIWRSKSYGRRNAAEKCACELNRKRSAGSIIWLCPSSSSSRLYYLDRLDWLVYLSSRFSLVLWRQFSLVLWILYRWCCVLRCFPLAA